MPSVRRSRAMGGDAARQMPADMETAHSHAVCYTQCKYKSTAVIICAGKLQHQVKPGWVCNAAR